MVMVSSVDSMPSANNGVIVQVLGEMSNQGTEARKFAQTFFLAEQPNGYYVLNDIFRFLREDIEWENEAAEHEAPVTEVKVPESVAVQEQPADKEHEEAAASAIEPATPENTTTATEPESKDVTVAHKPDEVVEKAAEPVANGVAAETTTKDHQQQRPKKSKDDKQKQKQHDKAAAAKSNAPKTWANLAANDSEKWGTQVAEAKGPVASVPVNTPKQSPQQQPQQAQTKPNKAEVLSVFVKNVQQGMTEDQLKEAFGKFGTIKFLNIVNAKVRDIALLNTSIAQQTINLLFLKYFRIVPSLILLLLKAHKRLWLNTR
jgi:hypothetical protein